MSLSTTQKFVLASLSPENKLSVLKKGNSSICLVASCIWDMLVEKVVVLNDKGQMTITGGLPDNLEYCRPIYDELTSKSNKLPKQIILSYTTALSDKRILNLTEGIVLQLAKQGYLTAVEIPGLFGHKIWKPEENNITDLMQIANSEELLDESDSMFAILVLESGLAKKLFSPAEIKVLKKNVACRDTSNFQPYLKNMINFVEQQIGSVIVSATVSTILVN